MVEINFLHEDFFWPLQKWKGILKKGLLYKFVFVRLTERHEFEHHFSLSGTHLRSFLVVIANRDSFGKNNLKLAHEYFII